MGFGLTAYLVIGRILGWWWLGDRPLLMLAILLVIVGLQLLLFGLLAEMLASDADPKSRHHVQRRTGAG